MKCKKTSITQRLALCSCCKTLGNTRFPFSVHLCSTQPAQLQAFCFVFFFISAYVLFLFTFSLSLFSHIFLELSNLLLGDINRCKARTPIFAIHSLQFLSNSGCPEPLSLGAAQSMVRPGNRSFLPSPSSHTCVSISVLALFRLTSWEQLPHLLWPPQHLLRY
jgi:hypothetical protein